MTDLAEAYRIVNENECRTHGHDYNVIMQNFKPFCLVCRRCSESWSIDHCHKESH